MADDRALHSPRDEALRRRDLRDRHEPALDRERILGPVLGALVARRPDPGQLVENSIARLLRVGILVEDDAADEQRRLYARKNGAADAAMSLSFEATRERRCWAASRTKASRYW